ncbi:hypothetical protein TNCV_1771541 [Trichonephila clavipes]|nr:hypothetical protein TNCV_1771541 [Trichonephila clavipes]
MTQSCNSCSNDNYLDLLNAFSSLEDDVTRKFLDFKEIESKFKGICYSITANIGTAPEELQLELFDLMSNLSEKEMFNAITLILQIFVS